MMRLFHFGNIRPFQCFATASNFYQQTCPSSILARKLCEGRRCFTADRYKNGYSRSEQSDAFSLPEDVARRLALFEHEGARQQKEREKEEKSSVSSGTESSGDSCSAPGILEVKDIKKRFSDDLNLQSRDDARRVYWHSAAHILGQAIELCLGSDSAQKQSLDVDASQVHTASPLLCDGPPLVGDVANQGFYYQFALPDGGVVSDEDLMQIEREMQRIVRERQRFERLEVTRSFAHNLFKDNTYKLEMLKRIPDTDPVTLFRNGPFVDLCRGPHVTDTSAFGAIKVLSSSAAHFRSDARGSETGGLVPVQRIYGIAFPKPKQLQSGLC